MSLSSSCGSSRPLSAANECRIGSVRVLDLRAEPGLLRDNAVGTCTPFKKNDRVSAKMKHVWYLEIVVSVPASSAEHVRGVGEQRTCTPNLPWCTLLQVRLRRRLAKAQYATNIEHAYQEERRGKKESNNRLLPMLKGVLAHATVRRSPSQYPQRRNQDKMIVVGVFTVPVS